MDRRSRDFGSDLQVPSQRSPGCRAMDGGIGRLGVPPHESWAVSRRWVASCGARSTRAPSQRAGLDEPETLSSPTAMASKLGQHAVGRGRATRPRDRVRRWSCSSSAPLLLAEHRCKGPPKAPTRPAPRTHCARPLQWAHDRGLTQAGTMRLVHQYPQLVACSESVAWRQGRD
jgi:hypothetical protein